MIAARRTHGLDEDLRDDRRAAMRSCAATRTVRPVDELIRFVRAPDGTVVPDLKRRLPGRGVWVTAEREAVVAAVRKRAFGRGFRAEVAAAPDLAARVEGLLERAALDMLGMANKAGLVVTGFAKVETALARGDAVAIVHAADGSPDGRRKLAAAARRSGRAVREIATFPGPCLDLALGRSNVVHAALLAGPASDAFAARADMLARFRGEPGPGPGLDGVAAPADGAGPPAGTDVE